jgi:CubicO group peptidase (beta-lactamase class C family)
VPDARHGLVIAVFLAVVLGAGTSVSEADSAVERRELTAADIAVFADSAFASYLQGSPHPSLAFVVVKDDAIVFARGYGMEDAASGRPVDPEATVFWLASLSKLVTTVAVLREVERERVALDAPAMQYLGWPLTSRNHWRAIAVADLLTHTSGLDEPFMQGTVGDSARLVSLGDYLSRMHWHAGTSPGAALRYSNHGMALAGLIVERTSGMPFAEYIEREIFAPLGMGHSTFRQPIPSELARHIATAGTDATTDYLLPAPAGAMVGTASDMGRFLIAQLDVAGAHAASLQVMHATQWRAHPAVPGVALGWFESHLGGVKGLFHTGARHHFSVAWLVPSRRLGLFLVHSMRQGGPYQNLRTEVVRAFAERYLVPDTVSVARATPLPSIDGIYRPGLLGTTTVERAGNLFLDTPVRVTQDGHITMQAPGGLGTITAYPIGADAFEVREGPQAGLRLGFVESAEGQPRIAMGGTLLDPVVFTRVTWWQRGLVHAVVLVVACLALPVAAVVHGVRRVVRRRRGTGVAQNPAWMVVGAAGVALTLAPLTFLAVLFSTPELNAADHMRSGIRAVLVLLSTAAALCAAIPIATILGWRSGSDSVAERATLCLLSLAGVVAAMLLWHYRLVGFHL